ncbi:hypothetical protein ACFL96_07215 [Thermoproteota archaeon]
MRKKSQVPSTVFMYALVAVIIALTLIFGYQVIQKLLTTQCQTDVAAFKSDVRNIIKQDTSTGKQDLVRKLMPCDYVTVCFVAADTLAGNALLDRFPVAEDVAESDHNAFLADLEGNIESFYVETIEVSPDNNPYGTAALCTDESTGYIEFRVQGKGTHAIILAMP